MPIYAYKCESCGFAKDVLQKISDPLLSECPACAQSTFKKQLTSAGFQLKGSGWYVTDFRGGNDASKPATGLASEAGGADSGDKANKESVSTSNTEGAAGQASASSSTTPAAGASKPAVAPAASSSASPSTGPSTGSSSGSSSGSSNTAS